jgi:hypothetical protein
VDANECPPPVLAGAPSDEVPQILATGRGDITTMFVSMAEKHPEGADADYLCWHTLDHRPEQQRLAAIRTSLRAVSTPACRAARAASDGSFEAVDHVMTYFFNDPKGLEAFNSLSIALRDAGRSPFILTPVQRAVYTVQNRVSAPRTRIGADVLPWLPLRGVYILLEKGQVSSTTLIQEPGVAGVWCAGSVASAFATAGTGQQLTYCFLDGDPVHTAETLRPVLEQRWRETGIQPLLAAPFYAVVPYEWDRYLP